MVDLVPYRTGHFLAMAHRDLVPGALGLPDDRPATLATCAESLAGPFSATLLNGPDVLGLMGVRVLHPGVGEAWTMTSGHLRVDAPSRSWVWFRRAAIYGLGLVFEAGLHRVQAHVRADFEGGHRLARSLAFIPEGPAVAWGPDRADHTRYARIA